MDFYTSIHPWYDQIFPFSEAQRDFVLSYGIDSTHPVLDVGCGTGSLILSLAGTFRTTAGIDPDEAMLESARQKALARRAGTWFLKAGMLDLAKEFAPGSFDRILCFGNTLPHLSNEGEVASFARQAVQTLRPSGILLIQLINYDRILDQGLTGLPTIENEEIRFVRQYARGESTEHVQFITRLTLRKTGWVIENEVPLLALRPDTLKTILREAGFGHFEEFGSFRKDPFTIDSQPHIIKASKD